MSLGKGRSRGSKIGRFHSAAVSWPRVDGTEDTVSHSKTEKSCSMNIPASLGEHNDGAGTALERSLNSPNGDGLCGVTSQMRGATQLLKHLPVEHSGLSLAGNLMM